VLADVPWPLADRESLPATHVSRVHVDGLLDRLNENPEGVTYWLPTDAEWEYACRAGTTSLWYFGDEASGLADNAWYRRLERS